MLQQEVRLLGMHARAHRGGVAIADEHERRRADLGDAIRGLVLLTRDDVPQVVLEIRPVQPERVVQPLHGLGMRSGELRREERASMCSRMYVS